MRDAGHILNKAQSDRGVEGWVGGGGLINSERSLKIQKSTRLVDALQQIKININVVNNNQKVQFPVTHLYTHNMVITWV